MDLETFRLYCLAKQGVTEGMPFGEKVLVFKVLHKMFATLRLSGDAPTANLKCDPLRAENLREMYPDIVPGYHMNKKHWNTLHIEGALPESLVEELIDHSYDLVVKSLPKKHQATLQENDNE